VLRQAKKQLPPRTQHVVKRLVMHEEPTAEVAKQLGVTRQRVQQLAAEAKEKLREALTLAPC
jgi:RNA polymerase sigma factor (sigma-70 family)